LCAVVELVAYAYGHQCKESRPGKLIGPPRMVP
jgi:hypothetical protein